MPCSDARIAANRANAQHSSGPKTDEGKERSRRNGLKHGLSGRGVVLPDEDRDEVEARVEALERELAPTSTNGAFLVRQMATCSVRMERSAEQETAALAKNVRHAADDFDEARIDAAEALFDSIHEEPKRTLRKLRRTPEGIECLVDGWRDLRDNLTADPKPLWAAAQMEQAALMEGIRPEHARGSRVGALSRAYWGDFARLSGCDGGGLSEEARQAWAKNQLIERIDAAIALLESLYKQLDFATIEIDRAEAGARALFDGSRLATLARRYEAEATRNFYKAMKEFRHVEAESLEHVESTPPPPPFESDRPGSPVGSSRARTTPPEPQAGRGRLEQEMPHHPPVQAPSGRPTAGGKPPHRPG